MATAKNAGDRYVFGKVVWSPVGLISYPYVWEPKLNDLSNKLQFQCSVLIDKNGASLKELSEAGLAVWAELSGSPIKSLKELGERGCPFKDGDEKDPEGPAAGHWMIHSSCSDKNPPFVVDKDNRPIGDRTAVYGGAIGVICVQPMAYTTKFGKGVNFQLKGVMKLADGKPFGEARYDPAKAGYKAPDVPAYLRDRMESARPSFSSRQPAGVTESSADAAMKRALANPVAGFNGDVEDDDATPF